MIQKTIKKKLLESRNMGEKNQMLRQKRSRNSLVVQRLGLGALTAGAQGQSLVGELRCRMPRGVAKKEKRKDLSKSLKFQNKGIILNGCGPGGNKSQESERH